MSRLGSSAMSTKNMTRGSQSEFHASQESFVFNQTNMSTQQGSGQASLKGKLNSLETQIKALVDELNYHKKEVQVLRSEKDTLESVLAMRTQEVRKNLGNEMSRIEDDTKRHFAQQKAENSRIQQQVTTLKGEKTAIQQQLLGLQRRVQEVEMQIGEDVSQ